MLFGLFMVFVALKMFRGFRPHEHKSRNLTVPQTNSNLPATPYVQKQTPTNMARTPTIVNSKKGISKGAKISIGIGVAALIGTGAYLLFRDKDAKPKASSKPKKKKQSLGTIELN